MLETGQPLHLFDYDTLPVKTQISVRSAPKKERMISLTGSELILSQDIVISSGKRTISLAGIIGAKRSAITSQTQNILVESATFQASSIRITTTRLGISTRASHYFSKEVNLTGQPLSVLHYLLSLSEKLGAKKSKIISAYYPEKKRKNHLLPLVKISSEKKLGI